MKRFCIFDGARTSAASRFFRTLLLAGACACTLGLNSCDLFGDDDEDDGGDGPATVVPPPVSDGRSLIRERVIKDLVDGVDELTTVQYDDYNRPARIDCYLVAVEDPSGETKPGDRKLLMTFQMDYNSGEVFFRYADAQDEYQSRGSFNLNASGYVQRVSGDYGNCAFAYTDGYMRQIRARIDGEETNTYLNWDNGLLTSATQGDLTFFWRYGSEANTNGFDNNSNIGVYGFLATVDPTGQTMLIADILASSGIFGKAPAKLPVSCVQNEDGDEDITTFSYTKDTENRVSSFTFDNYGDGYTFHYSY